MKSKFIIYSLFFLIAISAILSCAKTDTIPALQFQKQLLAGTGKYQNTLHSWQLDSTKINGANVLLTNTQKNFKKTFLFDGAYFDSDNNLGKWEITTINKLKQTIIYQSLNRQDSVVYDIVSINAAQLNLSIKLSNGQTAIYSFKISN